jgi:hypothetical protein
MERGRRKGRGMRTAPLFLVLVFLFMAVAAEERSDAGNVDVGGGGEEEAFDKRFLKLWTDGGGGDEEDHLRWYGDDDEYDDDEEEEDGDTVMLGGARCPRPTKKKKRNVVRVDDFGAAGDGCADDTEVHLCVRTSCKF